MNNESIEIQAIKSRYKSSLVEKAEMINSYINQVLDTDFSEIEVYENLNGDLHKLAGSSGMYGYQDIADISRSSMKCIVNGDKETLQTNLVSLRNLLRQYA